MAFKIIYGSASSGKTRQLFSEIKSQIEKNKAILIVPEQYSLLAEKNLTSFLNNNTNFMVDVLSFKRLSYRVFCETGDIFKKYINSAGKAVIMYKILNKNKKSLKIFGKAANFSGFASVLIKTVSEFKRYNITPKTLSSFIEKLDEKSLLKQKLFDLKQIFEAYDNEINKNYKDSDDDLTRLSNILDSYNGFESTSFYIDGFTGFTPNEYEIIKKLLKKAENVTITLCTDTLKIDEKSVFMPSITTAQKLLSICHQNNISILPHTYLEYTNNEQSCEIQFLEKQLFKYPNEKYHKKAEDILIYCASNVFFEVHFVATKIINLCREKNLSFRDFAVIVSDLNYYGSIISSIFNQYEINFFKDEKKDIKNHPLVTQILYALEAILSNFSYESIFKYLKTGIIEISNIDELENYCLENGIKWGYWQDEKKWALKDDINDFEKEKMERIIDARNFAINPLFSLKERLKNSSKVIDYCKAIYDFLTEIKAFEGLQSYINLFKEQGKLNLANEYTSIWNIIMEALDQLVTAFPDDCVTTEGFYNLLSVCLSEYEIGLVPPTIDEVLVSTTDRFNYAKTPYIFILGVNDRAIPSFGKNEGILSDKDRQILNGLGLVLAPETTKKALDEQFLIYKIFSSPQKKLFLSYPLSDFEGKGLRPSFLISRVKSIFPDIEVLNDDKLEILDFFVSKQVAFNNVLKYLTNKEKKDYIKGAYKWFLNDDFFGQRLINAQNSLDYVNSTENLKSIKNNLNKFSSISRLERFAACEFAYFMQYVLEAKEREIYKISAMDLGSIIHEILENFSKNLEKSGLSWELIDEDYINESLDQIIEATSKSKLYGIFQSSKRFKYFSEKLKKIIKRSLYLISEHFKRSDFKPIGYELSFDINGDFMPIEIDMGNGDKYLIRGKIDRADELIFDDTKYVRIIDYKSGSRELELSKVYYGLSLQLITYLNALCKNLSKNENIKVKPAGILYFKIDDPIVSVKSKLAEIEAQQKQMESLKMKGLLLSNLNVIYAMDKKIDGASEILPVSISGDEIKASSSVADALQIDKLLSLVTEKSKQLLAEISKGSVKINPYVEGTNCACDYCPYLKACNFDKDFNKYRYLKALKDKEFWELIID